MMDDTQQTVLRLTHRTSVKSFGSLLRHNRAIFFRFTLLTLRICVIVPVHEKANARLEPRRRSTGRFLSSLCPDQSIKAILL